MSEDQCRNYITDTSGKQQWVRFDCPRPGEPDSYTYCCLNPPDGQKCCRFMDVTSNAVGVAFSIVVLLFAVTLCIYLKLAQKPKPKEDVQGETNDAVENEDLNQEIADTEENAESRENAENIDNDEETAETTIN